MGGSVTCNSSRVCRSQAVAGVSFTTSWVATKVHSWKQASQPAQSNASGATRAQRCAAADLEMAALQAALPAPEAPADAGRSLLPRACPLPGTRALGAGRPAGGLCVDGGCAPMSLLTGEQAAAEGGRGPRRAHPGLPQMHAPAAGKPGSSNCVEPGASGVGHAVKRAASCELPCGAPRDRQEVLGPWVGSALPVALESPLALPDWQRLQTVVELLVSLGPGMPQSCKARACHAALLCIFSSCLPCTGPHICLQRSQYSMIYLGTAPMRMLTVML